MISCFRLSDNANFTLKNISKFSDARYPIRAPHDEYDKFRFVDNPFADGEIDFLYCATDGDAHVGQMLSLPNPLSYNEEIIPAYWGQDLYVLEDYRRMGINKEFSKFYLNKGYYVAIGFSKFSTITHKKQDINVIGSLDVYIKWASTFHKTKFLLQRGLKIRPKNVKSYRFPQEMSGFERITNVDDLHLPHLNWNKNVIESIRNKIYFQWRFFYKPNRYFVYQSKTKLENNSTYFVAKPYFFKGVNWLRVVDYRFDNNSPEEFDKILNAVEKLRNRLNLFGVIITSSQKLSNDLLDQNNFKLYKQEMVMTNYPFQHQQTDEAHNHFMISFADGDLDMHTNLGKFNYGQDY